MTTICAWCFPGLRTINGEQVSHGICAKHKEEMIYGSKPIRTNNTSGEQPKHLAVEFSETAGVALVPIRYPGLGPIVRCWTTRGKRVHILRQPQQPGRNLGHA